MMPNTKQAQEKTMKPLIYAPLGGNCRARCSSDLWNHPRCGKPAKGARIATLHNGNEVWVLVCGTHIQPRVALDVRLPERFYVKREA